MGVPGVALPARQRRVKAICELAALASGIYCTIIIINNTDLFNFFQFSCLFKMRYHATTCLVEISCVHARLHAHVYLHITYNNINTHGRPHTQLTTVLVLCSISYIIHHSDNINVVRQVKRTSAVQELTYAFLSFIPIRQE